MSYKKRLLLVVILLLAFAVTAPFARRPDSTSLTVDELFATLGERLGKYHVEWGHKFRMTRIDAGIIRRQVDLAPIVVRHLLGTKKARKLFGTREEIWINLEPRAVAAENLVLIARVPDVQRLSLGISRPLDDEEVRAISEMRDLKVCDLNMSSAFAVGPVDIERLARLSDLRYFFVRVNEIDAKVIAALARLKSLEWLSITLPTEYHEQKAREEYAELTRALPACRIQLSAHPVFRIP